MTDDCIHQTSSILVVGCCRGNFYLSLILLNDMLKNTAAATTRLYLHLSSSSVVCLIYLCVNIISLLLLSLSLCCLCFIINCSIIYYYNYATKSLLLLFIFSVNVDVYCRSLFFSFFLPLKQLYVILFYCLCGNALSLV